MPRDRTAIPLHLGETSFFDAAETIAVIERARAAIARSAAAIERSRQLLRGGDADRPEGSSTSRP